jgi:hypothetical protein
LAEDARLLVAGKDDPEPPLKLQPSSVQYSILKPTLQLASRLLQAVTIFCGEELNCADIIPDR